MFRFLHVIVLVFTSITLSGCFFSQEAPQTMVSQGSFILGSVAMRDMTVSNQGGLALVEAVFAKESQKKTEPVSVMLGNREQDIDQPADFNMELIETSRGPACAAEKFQREKTARADDMGLSVGPMYFGPSLQNNLRLLDKSSKNVYQMLLTPGLPAGAYDIIAPDGEDGVAPFGERFTMPEQLEWVRVQNIDFGEPIMEYRKGDKLVVAWRQPTVENSENQVLIQFTGRTDKEVFFLTCQAHESDLMPVKEQITWTIDQSFLQDVPKGSTISIQLTRGHVLQAKRKATQILLKGFRTFYSKMDYIE